MLKIASLTRSGIGLVASVGGRSKRLDRHFPAMILITGSLIRDHVALTRPADANYNPSTMDNWQASMET
jgi:hypothetical protein